MAYVYMVFIVLVIFSAPETNCQTVSTANGNVTGVSKTILGKSIDVFYGIPFAKSPVGPLRFKRPEPVEPWSPDVLIANVSKPSCYQEMRQRPDPLEYIPPDLSEDCLHMDIYVPRSSTKNMAVVIWFYGGGYESGSINMLMFDGKILASVNDVIVVNVNYRVGVLGFLYLDSQTVQGNMGLLDQHLAIKWVHENIHNFGGNSNRITLAGQSAGAASVSHHLLSPLSRPYFNGAIMDSGGPLAGWSLLSDDEAKTYSHSIAEKANCALTSANIGIYECLNEKSPEELVKLQYGIAPGANVAFGPVVDGFFLVERPVATLQNRRMKNCSILSGFNLDEGSLFLAYGNPSVFQWKNNITISEGQFRDELRAQAATQHGSNVSATALFQEYIMSRVPADRDYVHVASDLLGDFSFKCPVTRFVGLYAPVSDVYLYSYVHRPAYSREPDWFGVKHSAELPLLWGHALDPNSPVNFTKEEVTLSRTLMTYWTDFAKFGSPNSEGSSLPDWPIFDNEEERYITLDVGGVFKVGKGLRRPECTFLYETIPLIASLEKSEGGTVAPCSVTVGGSQGLKPIIALLVTTILAVRL